MHTLYSVIFILHPEAARRLISFIFAEAWIAYHSVDQVSILTLALESRPADNSTTDTHIGTIKGRYRYDSPATLYGRYFKTHSSREWSEVYEITAEVSLPLP